MNELRKEGRKKERKKERKKKERKEQIFTFCFVTHSLRQPTHL
jgi:hypothetical protein